MYEIHHNELGKIIVKTHSGAKNIIARKKQDGILLTVPKGCNSKNVENALEKLKIKILQTPPPAPPPLITEETRIETLAFTASIRQTIMTEKYLLSLKNNELTVFVPSDIDITSPAVQQQIKHIILEALRMEAKKILPQKTDFLAKKLQIPYAQVKINSSRSRWGSCSSGKIINLSLFLLFLPEEYVDYVILHELAHTMEMNHGIRFWHILSKMCGEDAKKISRNLRKLQIESMRYFPR